MSRDQLTKKFNFFCQNELKNYSSKRNFDFGPPHTNVSNLSPYINRRYFDEVKVLLIALKHNKIEKIEKFVQEVFWGTYWKGWLESHPWIYDDYQKEYQYPEIPLSTGIKCFDHWTEELIETGYLHNHARMWYASIWIFTLNKPWKLGANFFKKHLLDWCPASNTLGWRWVAGLQTVGKNYLARAENINFYTIKKFNPKNQLNEKASPILSDDFIKKSVNTIPKDFVDISTMKEIGLVLNKNDLSLNYLFEKKDIINHCCVFSQEDKNNIKSKLVMSFEQKLVEEIVNNHSNFELIENFDELILWAKRKKIKNLIFPYETVGNTILNKKVLLNRLNKENINFTFYMRDWDRYAYPHATKGFFNFKKKISELLILNKIVS